MRRIALTSVVGGMLLSLAGMCAASLGYLTPIQGAIAQEMIDLLSILNSLRMILPAGQLSDFHLPLIIPVKGNCRGLRRILFIRDMLPSSSGGEAHHTAVVRLKSPSGTEWAQERIQPDLRYLRYSLQPLKLFLQGEYEKHFRSSSISFCLAVFIRENLPHGRQQQCSGSKRDRERQKRQPQSQHRAGCKGFQSCRSVEAVPFGECIHSLGSSNRRSRSECRCYKREQELRRGTEDGHHVEELRCLHHRRAKPNRNFARGSGSFAGTYLTAVRKSSTSSRRLLCPWIYHR